MGLFSSSSSNSVATQPGAGMPQRAIDRGIGSVSSASSNYSSDAKGITQFPLQWHAFVKKYNMKSMALKLGEDRDRPIYSVSMPWGYYGKMHLHNGPDPERDPVIATASHHGMFYSSTISLAGGIKTDFKPNWSTNKFEFECPVGPNGETEKFQWKGGKGGTNGKFTLTRLSTGEALAMYDEGKTGWSLPTAFTFNFEPSALDGHLGPVFPIMAAASGIRCWQSTKNIRYTTGAAAGSSAGASVAVA